MGRHKHTHSPPNATSQEADLSKFGAWEITCLLSSCPRQIYMVGVLGFLFITLFFFYTFPEHDATDTLLKFNYTSGLALHEAFYSWSCVSESWEHGRKGIFILELILEKWVPLLSMAWDISPPHLGVQSQVHKGPTVSFNSRREQKAINLDESWWGKIQPSITSSCFSIHMSLHCLPTHSQWGRIRIVSKSPPSTMSVLASRWSFCIKLEMEQVDKVQTFYACETCGNLLVWAMRPFEIGFQPLRLAIAPAALYPAAIPDGVSPITPGEGHGKSKPHFRILRTGFLLPLGWNLES